MSTEKKRHPVSVARYLKSEEDSPIKHEFVEGFVYAMTGAKNVHNTIALNIQVGLSNRLRGQTCRVFNADTKVRLKLASGVRFYYPDAQVVCRPNRQDDVFQDHPVAIFEVISPRTRRIDEGEKKDAYLAIASLVIYVLVEQASAQLVAFRRTEKGFVREELAGLTAELSIPELKLELPLAEVYDGVDLRAPSIRCGGAERRRRGGSAPG